MPDRTLDQQRHDAQLAFAAGSAPLVVGSLADTPFSVPLLKRLRPGDPGVSLSVESGLTGHVHRLTQDGTTWSVKQALARSKVQNTDGQTSFLNEVQRRRDFTELKKLPGGEARWAGIVDTQFASYRDGLILSPWIEGEHVSQWDEPKLRDLLTLACRMWLAGLFEWDLCRGNILFDGQRIRLFDFGYTYRFDPNTQFNSAGHGTDVPLFHPVERFETRCFSAHLLQLEDAEGMESALAAFALLKLVALEAYEQMRREAAQAGASAQVLEWLASIIAQWRRALSGDLHALYLAECWRSHVLDVDDDLRGKTCTPLTLARADWLLAALRQHGATLRKNQAFFWGDEQLELTELLARYTHHREQAVIWQIGAAAGRAHVPTTEA